METLAWSESTKTEEVLYLVNSLEIQGWLPPNHPAIGYLGYGITVEGYSYLAEIDHAVADSPASLCSHVVRQIHGRSLEKRAPASD